MAMPWWVAPVAATCVFVVCIAAGCLGERHRKAKKQQALRQSLLYQTSKAEMAGFRAAAMAAAAAEAGEAPPPPPVPVLRTVFVQRGGSKLRKGVGRFTPLVTTADGGAVQVGDQLDVLEQTTDKKGIVWLKVRAQGSGAVGYLQETATLGPHSEPGADDGAGAVPAEAEVQAEAIAARLRDAAAQEEKVKEERKRKMEERFAAMAARESFQLPSTSISAVAPPSLAGGATSVPSGGILIGGGVDESAEVVPQVEDAGPGEAAAAAAAAGGGTDGAEAAAAPADTDDSIPVSPTNAEDEGVGGAGTEAAAAAPAAAAVPVVDASVEVSSSPTQRATSVADAAAAEGAGGGAASPVTVPATGLSPRQAAIAARFASLKVQLQETEPEAETEPEPEPGSLGGSE
jgi:hypothetical protein